MKFLLLEELVRAHANELSRQDGLGGGRGDGGSYAWLQKLENLKNKLIILHDLRPSEVEVEIPKLNIGNLREFKEVIDTAKLELISDMDYEDLAKWIKVM